MGSWGWCGKNTTFSTFLKCTFFQQNVFFEKYVKEFCQYSSNSYAQDLLFNKSPCSFQLKTVVQNIKDIANTFFPSGKVVDIVDNKIVSICSLIILLLCALTTKIRMLLNLAMKNLQVTILLLPEQKCCFEELL